MKNYKILPPEQTINNIRNILNNLGILLHEKNIAQEDIYSCRVSIGNNDLMPLCIGTNGKGRSFEYSLASGYAEFMERLQNQLLLNPRNIILGKIFSNLSYHKDLASNTDESYYAYDINESRQRADYFIDKMGDELVKLTLATNKEEFRSIIESTTQDGYMTAIPFYSVTDKKTVEMPIEFLLSVTGSNGMAAGNSPKEAILQAICEIFERYVINEIYWKRLMPPTIPLETFKGTKIYDTIVKYNSHKHYEIMVKDCSLGLGIPALGLLIIDRATQTYNFKLGVDTIPSVALERCFQEVHQGRKDYEALPYHFLSNDYHTEAEKFEAENNILKIFKCSVGYWPESILYDQGSWEFKGFDNTLGQSNAADLKYFMSFVQKMGFNIFIRNNSILGFPTYFVVIPGMSQNFRRYSRYNGQYTQSFKHIKLMNRLGSINEEIARDLFKAIDENYNTMKERLFEFDKVFMYNVNPDLHGLSIELFTSCLAYYLSDLNNSLKYLKLFLQNKDKQQYRYFYAAAYYLELRIANNKQTEHLLKLLYGNELGSEIIEDFKNPHQIFQYYQFPNCPDCLQCQLQNYCRLKQVEALDNKIKAYGRKHPIDQMQTKDDLENEIE